MKNHERDLSKFESMTTIIVNIGTIVSWIITLITAVTLIAQPQPIKVPGILELGKPYIVFFLVSILLGYLQVLRHFWRLSRLKKSNAESSFESYLYASIVRFKRPFVSMGFVVIFIPIIQTEPEGASVVLALIILFGGTYLFVMFFDKPEKFKWKFNDEFSRRWFKRVENRLHDYGYVFTSDFDNLHVGESEVNLAIENYFNRYEFEKDLVLTKRADVGIFYTSYLLELRFDHLPSQLLEKQEI